MDSNSLAKNIADKLHELADQIECGKLKDYRFVSDQEQVFFHVSRNARSLRKGSLKRIKPTARRQLVRKMIAEGKTIVEISDHLKVSKNTVEKDLKKINKEDNFVSFNN